MFVRLWVPVVECDIREYLDPIRIFPEEFIVNIKEGLRVAIIRCKLISEI